MSHSIYDITEFNVQLDRERLDQMLDRARALGYLEGYEPDEDGPTLDAVHELLSELFPVAWDHDASQSLNGGYFEWYDGARFPENDLCEILAVAAIPGSSLTFIDFDDYGRDIYEEVFDGEGQHHRVFHVRDGAPVRKAA